MDKEEKKLNEEKLDQVKDKEKVENVEISDDDVEVVSGGAFTFNDQPREKRNTSFLG